MEKIFAGFTWKDWNNCMFENKGIKHTAHKEDFTFKFSIFNDKASLRHT